MAPGASLVRDFKNNAMIANFGGDAKLWSTKPYSKDERDRIQPVRMAVWAIRKLLDAKDLDLEVGYVHIIWQAARLPRRVHDRQGRQRRVPLRWRRVEAGGRRQGDVALG